MQSHRLAVGLADDAMTVVCRVPKSLDALDNCVELLLAAGTGWYFRLRAVALHHFQLGVGRDAVGEMRDLGGRAEKPA